MMSCLLIPPAAAGSLYYGINHSPHQQRGQLRMFIHRALSLVLAILWLWLWRAGLYDAQALSTFGEGEVSAEGTG